MKSHTYRAFLISTILLLGTSCSPPVSFSKNIKPILTASCLECHAETGEGYQASGFSVQTYNSVMKGTKYGAVIIPGSSISSTLYRLVAQKVDMEIQMPPHHKEGLPKGRSNPLS